LKNKVFLEDNFLPDDPERQIGAFIDHDTNRQYHVCPALRRRPTSRSSAAIRR